MSSEPVQVGPSPGSRFLKNSGFIFGTQIWFIALSLLSTPYIVHHLGVDSYGVFALLLVLTGYLSYLDLGLGWALIKFVAEHDAKGEIEALQRCVSTTLFVMVATGVVGAGTLILLADSIAGRLLQLPPGLLNEAKHALWMASLTFFFASVTGALSSTLKGLHRFELTSILQVSSGTACIVGTVGVLSQGFGLSHVMMVYAVVAACGLMAHVLVLRSVRPSLPGTPWLHAAELGRMFSFSVFTTFTKMGMLAIFQLDKLIVAFLMPVAFLSYYTIPFNVAQRLNVVASNAATVLFPLASAQFSTNNIAAYHDVYHHTAKIVFLLTAVPTVIIIAFAEPFLRVWLGPEFAAQGTVPFVLLAIAFCAVSIASVEAVSIEAAGRPGVMSGMIGLAGLANVILCPILTSRYGIVGTAASLTIALMALAVGTITFFNRTLLKSAIGPMARNTYVRPIALVGLAGSGAWLLARLPMSALGTVLVTMTGFAGAICVVGFWFVLDTDEQRTLKAFLTARLA